METNIRNAVKKCDNQYGPWCGYLRPDEIVELVKHKWVVPNKYDEYHVDWAKEKVEKGIMNPMWFYFQPRKKFLELHRGMKRKGVRNG